MSRDGDVGLSSVSVMHLLIRNDILLFGNKRFSPVPGLNWVSDVKRLRIRSVNNGTMNEGNLTLRCIRRSRLETT